MRKKRKARASSERRRVVVKKQKKKRKAPPRGQAERLYFSDNTWRDVYDRESQAHMTQEEEWIAALSTLAAVADKRFFEGRLFKAHGLEIVPKPLRSAEFYRYHLAERDGNLRHYFSFDSKILTRHDADFGHYREGIVHVLLHALCAAEAKMWQNNYWLCDGEVAKSSEFTTSVSDKREGGGAEADREEHRAQSQRVRQLIHQAEHDAKTDFIRESGNVWEKNFKARDPKPPRYASSVRETRTENKEWRRMAFLRLKEICGYVPKTVQFSKPKDWSGPYALLPNSLSCRRRKT